MKNDLQYIHFFVQKFVDTKKTFLYNVFCYYFRFRKKIVFCIIFSNIVSLLLSNNQISHFIFKIFLHVTNNIVCNIICDTYLYNLLKRIKLIIWNKILMQHKHCFTNVHYTLTNLLNNNHIYKNISMIFENNFIQILSIIKKNNQKTIVNANI